MTLSIQGSAARAFSKAVDEGVSTVILAVSGGIDSVVLAELAARCPRRPQLVIAHVDHGLRPSSVADACFVRALGHRLGILTYVIRLDVAAGASMQHHARYQRYASLGELADRLGAERLVTGHQADDQLESFALARQRGGRWNPMAELSWFDAAHVSVWRPLLTHSRDEIAAWARRERVRWVEDPSNAGHDYQRNRVRHALNADRSRRAALRDAMDAAVIMPAPAPAGRPSPWSASVTRSEDVQTDAERVVANLEGAFLGATAREELARLPRDARQRICGHRCVIDVEHDDVTAERTWGQGTRWLDARQAPPITVDLGATPRGELSWFDLLISWDASCDGTLVLRGPCPGDRIAIDRGTHHKRVVDVLREARVPRHERWRVPVATWRDEIVAVGQFRRSARRSDALRLEFAPRKKVEEFC